MYLDGRKKDSNSSNLYFENTLISGSWEYFDLQYKTYFNQASLKMPLFVNNCSVGLGMSFIKTLSIPMVIFA